MVDLFNKIMDLLFERGARGFDRTPRTSPGYVPELLYSYMDIACSFNGALTLIEAFDFPFLHLSFKLRTVFSVFCCLFLNCIN